MVTKRKNCWESRKIVSWRWTSIMETIWRRGDTIQWRYDTLHQWHKLWKYIPNVFFLFFSSHYYSRPGTSIGKSNAWWSSSKTKMLYFRAYRPTARSFTSLSAVISLCQCVQRKQIKRWTRKCSTNWPVAGFKVSFLFDHKMISTKKESHHSRNDVKLKSSISRLIRNQ